MIYHSVNQSVLHCATQYSIESNAVGHLLLWIICMHKYYIHNICHYAEAQRFDWSSPWRLWGQRSCSKAGWSRRASSAARRSAELKACQKPEKYTDRSCRNTSHTVTSAIWADHSPAASSDQPIGILAAQSAWWSRQSDASERHRASQLPKSVL